ncbi:MAG: cell division protein FtsQ/DivIB [Candidatus Limnocylindrales bacterium]
MTTSRAFALAPDGLTVEGATYADPAALTNVLGLDPAAPPNLFALDTARLARALRQLPSVDPLRADAVAVRVVLPDRLVVELHERTPIMLWVADGQRFLVDVDGVALGLAGDAPPAGLPLISDDRASATAFQVGAQLTDIDLAVARLIGALTPALLGSSATSLAFEVGDEEGWVVRPADGTWRAVFGIYTTHGRGPDLVAAQVQCLASLLAGKEASVAVAYLFPEGGRCGTYAKPAASP